MWLPIVGKIRTVQAPLVNHCWQVTLYVSPRELTDLDEDATARGPSTSSRTSSATNSSSARALVAPAARPCEGVLRVPSRTTAASRAYPTAPQPMPPGLVGLAEQVLVDLAPGGPAIPHDMPVLDCCVRMSVGLPES
jgi:Family of unknown function (DUF5996)